MNVNSLKRREIQLCFLMLITAFAVNLGCKPKHETKSAALVFPNAPRDGSVWINSLGMSFQQLQNAPVLVGLHEVRVRDFRRFVQESGTRWDTKTTMSIGATSAPVKLPSSDDHPVVNVTWHQAVAFCAWLAKAEGGKRVYRLPSHAEWTAVSGAGTTKYYWGDSWPPRNQTGNYSDRSSRRHFGERWKVIEGYFDGFPYLAPVMSFRPNSLGFFDLDGNASEWLNDQYPQVGSKRSGDVRIAGGSWFSVEQEYFDPHAELSEDPKEADVSIGFRCVIEL